MSKDHGHLGVQELDTSRAYYPQLAYCQKCRDFYTYYIEIPRQKRTEGYKERRKLNRSDR